MAFVGGGPAAGEHQGQRGQGNQASSESESVGELESLDNEAYPVSPDGLPTSGDLEAFEGVKIVYLNDSTQASDVRACS